MVGMEVAGVLERGRRIGGVRGVGAADADVVEGALVAVREVVAWADAQQAGLVGQLAGLVSFPAGALAEASKRSVGAAR